jgi:hypothetical protein
MSLWTVCFGGVLSAKTIETKNLGKSTFEIQAKCIISPDSMYVPSKKLNSAINFAYKSQRSATF